MKKPFDYLSNEIKKNLFACKLVFYILIPAIILFLPIDYFDKSGESVCFSVLLFDVECYACGMTSACKHLLHFDFETAFAYNMLSFVVLPLLAYLWVVGFVKDVKYYFTFLKNDHHKKLF